MDRLQFISALVQALAWPSATVVGVLLLRRPLASMLSGPVRRWKAGPTGVEVEYWDRQTDVVRTELRQAVGAIPAPETTSTDEMDLPSEMESLAEVSPAAAILESYGRIERELRDALLSTGLTIERPMTGRALARKAEELGLLSPENARGDRRVGSASQPRGAWSGAARP